VTSPAAPWLTFLASPAAPKSALSPLALDGYLTGVVVAPNLILPSLWIAALWGGEETVFDNDAEIGTVMGTVMAHYNALGTEIDRSLKRLEDERVCDYRPAFLTMGGEPARDAVREWIGGFWKAMALAPEGWSAMAEDERTQVLISPFVGFLDLEKTKRSNLPRTSTSASTRVSSRSRVPSSSCTRSPSSAQRERLKYPHQPAAPRSGETIHAPADQAKNTSTAAAKAEPSSTKPV